MTSILSNILNGVSNRERAEALAREAGPQSAPRAEEMGRDIQPTPHAHQIPPRPRLPLAERITQAAGIYPEARDVTPPAPSKEQMGPGTAVRHMEHLERQVAMAEMRLKESRQELAEMTARFGEATVEVTLMEQRYEELDYSEIAEWVEQNVFPRLREVLGMPKVLTVLALFVVALPTPAGETRSREWSRESTDRESRESRETNEWSSDWSGPGAGHQIVPEPGSAAPLLAVAGAAMVLRRRRAAERRLA